jgi:acetyl esterase/lipase
MDVVAGWVSLFLGAIGVMTAWAAVMPRRGSIDKASMWYLGFSLTGSELSVLLCTGGVVLAVIVWALGAARHPVGQVALALHGVAVAGLLFAVWRARTTLAVIDAALRSALGNDYEHRITPQRRALLQRKLQPSLWWKPFSYQRPDVKWIRDLPYVEGGHVQQRLDVLVPTAPVSGPRPVLLNIHGGGWVIGNKGTEAMPLLMHMARCGWLVVDADYRLSPGVRMPEHLIDVKRAIAWTRAHAPEYGGDPDFIVLVGGSVGGHLISLAALTAHQPQWQPGFEQADTRVQAVVPCYGKFDLLEQVRPDPRFMAFLTEKVMPGPRAVHDELWRAMDPASQMADPQAPPRPPFFVLHGTHDVLIPLAEARWFVERLRATSDSELICAELPGAQHGWDVPHSLRSDLTVEAMQRYLEYQYSQWLRARPAA